jgi:hypothetical protein
MHDAAKALDWIARLESAQQSTVLTEFVRRPGVKACLQAAIRLPPLRRRHPLVVPAAYSGYELDYSVLGYAYEYWLRLALVSDGKRVLNSFIGYRYGRWHANSGSLKEDFLRHKASVERFKGSALYNRNLYRSCIFFGYYELEYRDPLRVGLYSTFWPGTIGEEYVSELDALARRTRVELFDGTKSVALSPVFDIKGSRATLKGDGDFIVGRTLYDVKVVRTFALMSNLYQLVGYWAMNEIARTMRSRSRGVRKINSVALFFPRFDHVEIFSIDRILSHQAQRKLLKIFADYLGKAVQHESSRTEFAVEPQNDVYSY